MAKNVDDNQREIVRTARAMGATVCLLHEVGRGVPDLLIGYHGKNYLWEIKDGNKIPSKQKLTDAQRTWHKNWRGQATVITSIDDAVEFLQHAAQGRPLTSGVTMTRAGR